MTIGFRMLGSVDLRRGGADGEEIRAVVCQPKRLALLAYLAAARPGGYHRRDRLLAMFWPEHDGTRARDSLNQTLRFLRQALGASAVVSRGADEVGLDADIVRCDVLAFRAALSGSRPADALALYRGDLLDGVFVSDAPGFEEWLETERALVREEAAQAARMLAEQEEVAGKITCAVRWGRRAATLARDDERALRRLLALLWRAGDRVGALQAYDEFARRLHDEYESEPAAETRALVDAIRRDARGATTMIIPAPVPAPAPAAPGVGDATPVLANALAIDDSLGDGRYAIESELGAGGMATVYLARDVRHERRVAIKLLRPEIAATVGNAGFRREMRIAAGLQHPHIVPLFDSGEVHGRPYYVMPRVEGESLRARLDRDGAIPIVDAVRIARQIAGALAHAHRRGIVHRDIKPDNVLLTGDASSGGCHALITDFGIARAIAQTGAEARLTLTGIVLGSPAYMSPEHAAGGATLDGRSDIYSLGCVLFEMLAGEVPFPGESASSVLARHVHARIPMRRLGRRAVPRWLVRALHTALAKSPSERFATADAFASALESGGRSVSPSFGDAVAQVASGVWKRVGLIAASAFLASAAMIVTRWVSTP